VAVDRTPALVTAPILEWARTQARLSIPEAAARLGVKPEKLEAWESGSKHPTMKQARQMADLYDRPLGTFYLDAPPASDPPTADYRTAKKGDLSFELVAEIRRVHALRDAAADLAEETEDAFPSIGLTIRLDEPPGHAADRVRSWLDVPTPRPWNDAAGAFRWLRRRVEERGILVFIARSIPSDETSGFTLWFDVAPAIAINGKDKVSRRVFSLMHELVHVLLRQGGISDDDADSTNQVETFCNEVAGHVLIPRGDLHNLPIVVSKKRTGNRSWEDAEIKLLADRFGVSLGAMYVRLIREDLAARSDYSKWRARMKSAVADEEPEFKEGGGPGYYTMKIHDLGLPYLGRVFEAFQSKVITLADVCNYVGAKADTARKLEAKVQDRLVRSAG
jgi:Zn-dependent peptidase ImmA (M78 family)